MEQRPRRARDAGSWIPLYAGYRAAGDQPAPGSSTRDRQIQRYPSFQAGDAGFSNAMALRPVMTYCVSAKLVVWTARSRGNSLKLAGLDELLGVFAGIARSRRRCADGQGWRISVERAWPGAGGERGGNRVRGFHDVRNARTRSVTAATKMRQFRPTLLGIGLGALVFAVVAIATAPGSYSPDSVGQLLEAQRGVYSDGHPPIMAGLWSLLLRISGTAETLYWLHLALLSSAFVLFALAFRRSHLRGAIWLLLPVACSPAILNFIGVLWKDVGLAVSLAFCFACVALSRAARAGQLATLLVVLVMSFYAVGVRHNALPAVLPLLWLSLLPFFPRPGWRRNMGTATFAIIGTGLLFIGGQLVSYQLLDAKRVHPEQVIELYDLAGISVISGTDVIPDEAKSANFSSEALRAAYSPEYLNPLIFRPDPAISPPLQGTGNPNYLTIFRQAWEHAIINHPWAYLSHRGAIFASLLRIGWHTPFYAMVDYRQEAADFEAGVGILGDPALKSIDIGRPIFGQRFAASLLMAFVNWAAVHTYLFFGWLWLLVLVATLVAAIVLRKRPMAEVAIGLSASGLLYLLPYFFAAPSSDFRYLYWSIVAASLSTVIMGGILMQVTVVFLKSRESQARRESVPESGCMGSWSNRKRHRAKIDLA